jgi:methyl-accepting chemotaxis protein
MKLRTQIVAFGCAGALLAALAGGIGLLASSRLGQSIEEAILAGHALQASQEADMMHDAIRGDGQLALLGALEKVPERIAEAERGLKDHAATYGRSLAQLEKLPLSRESRDALASVKPLVGRYIEAAEHMVKSSSTDVAAAQRAVPALQAAFAQLEDGMEALSKSIEKRGTELNEHAQAGVSQTQFAIGAALLLATAAMLGLALWLARRMTRPMAHAVSVADQLAQGDLSVPIRPAGNDETVRLLQAMADMQTSFSGIVRDVQANADRVASASTQIAQGNQDLSGRTEQQASSLQQTAATMEQFGTNVRNNADNARQANQLALGATSVAAKGGAMMGQVVETMTGINTSSRKIAEIIGVIDGIAFQTNILALNAAVEAARAGEQGRGFAVVAGEVRNLAQRSAEAAREIKTLITASVERVEQGTALVGQAGKTMDEIVSSIQRVTDIVGEISSASVEQSAGVDQVGQAVTQMDQATQQNAALVEQSAAAAESLRLQSQQLVRAVAAFKLAEAADAAAAATPRAAERRGPDRARNVARAPFGAPPAAPAAGESAPARMTGTDGRRRA